jgi:hypothetical protein
VVSRHPVSGRSRRRRRRKPLLWPFAEFYPLRTGFPCRSIDGFSSRSPTPLPPPVGRCNNSLARRYFFPSPRRGLRGGRSKIIVSFKRERAEKLIVTRIPRERRASFAPHQRSIEDLRTPTRISSRRRHSHPRRRRYRTCGRRSPGELPSLPREDTLSRCDDPSLRRANTAIRRVPAT